MYKSAISLKEYILGVIERAKRKKNPIWKEYEKRVINKLPCVDYVKGCGYYLPETGLHFINIIDRHQADEWEMQSGGTGIWKLLSYKLFHDPDDMVEESTWQFLGYKGEKLLSEMTFDEFTKFYMKNFKEHYGRE